MFYSRNWCVRCHRNNVLKIVAELDFSVVWCVVCRTYLGKRLRGPKNCIPGHSETLEHGPCPPPTSSPLDAAILEDRIWPNPRVPRS